jgi:aquaporin Z
MDCQRRGETLEVKPSARAALVQLEAAERGEGFGDLSPGHYNLVSCAITEVLLTFFFVLVILGATSAGAPAGFAPLAIGLTLTLIVLIAIPVTNASVNPARSTGPAIFAGKVYNDQLWFFWLAPVSGAIVAGILGRGLFRAP